LGADVPFFVYGQNAFVQGIGEIMTPVQTPARCFAVVFPGIPVSTASIFAAPELTRDTESLRIPHFSTHVQGLDSMLNSRAGAGSRTDLEALGNDLEPVAAAMFLEVSQALDWLGRQAFAGGADSCKASMSGSGACVFRAVSEAAAGRDVLRGLPVGWLGWISRSLFQHPLRNFAGD
jgi:4-diphosphocytidyl-2-C-methyl-D-erythritol kinase